MLQWKTNNVCVVELNVTVNKRKNVECCPVMLLWRIYVARHDKPHLDLHSCWQAVSITGMTYTYSCVYSARPLMMDRETVRNM